MKPGSDQGAITHAGEQSSSEKSDQTEQNTVDATTDSGSGDTAEVKVDASAGEQVFADNCSTCHGADGKGGNGGPDLSAVPNAGDMTAVVQADHRRWRWHAGVQRAAEQAADRRRRRVRDAEGPRRAIAP